MQPYDKLEAPFFSKACALAASVCLAMSAACPMPSAAYNVRLKDVENPAMQSGKHISIRYYVFSCSMAS